VSVIRLRLDPKPAEDFDLCLAATPFVRANHPHIAVDVIVGEQVLGRWTYDVTPDGVGVPSERTVTIPAALMQDSLLSVELRIDRRRSPSEIGVSDDKRRLGLMAHRLAFRPVAVTAAP
jgi:hypothetical protein